MGIRDSQIEYWIEQIAAIEGIEINGGDLVDDLALMAETFPEEGLFDAAVHSVVHAFRLLIVHRSLGSPLVGGAHGWTSYHFQSAAIRKQPADLRIIYRDTGTVIRIRGFGHRHFPADIYRRLSTRLR